VAVSTEDRPASAEEMAALLAEGDGVRPQGGATKLDWGGAGSGPARTLSTERLDELVEHNEGDLTAVLQAGVTLARAREVFAAKGQRLCLDPPDGEARATIGGIVACGDSGPVRHRYGAVRDLILGVRVALADGTVARAGSKVIKNVAGYDLAKLMCGALGTLGVVCEVTVRLNPLAEGSVTAVGRGEDAQRLAAAARQVARRPLELEGLDVRWEGPQEGGAVLARAVGRAAEDAAQAAAAVMGQAGLATEIVADDEGLWERQRAGQRAASEEAMVRVSAPPAALAQVLAAAPRGAVARAGLGLAWLRTDADPRVLVALRERLSPASCVLEQAPVAMRAAVDPWGVLPGPELELARRVKLRFDPHGVCNPGRFVGGL